MPGKILFSMYMPTLQKLLVFLVILFLLPVPSSQSASMEDEQKYSQVIRMYREYTQSFPKVADIPSKKAIELLNNSDTVFVDVRKVKEQKVSMIPGAITKKEFLDNLDRYHHKHIIAYCTISYRSGKFAKKMAQKGVSITNLEAGLLGWVHEGGPLFHENKEVNKLHVYGKKWNLAPAAIDVIF